MLREEIIRELSLSYYDLVDYLLKKYGAAEYDYFSDPSFKRKTRRKVTRTDEGLICHHIDEDKGVCLSRKGIAATQPFDWQKKERLVYCNYIEHFILHIKIAILRQKSKLKKPEDISKWFTTGGIYLICNDINDLYINKGSKKEWLQNCYNQISNNYSEYITLIKLIFFYIDNQYIGKKEKAFLKEGAIYQLSNVYAEVVELSKAYDKVKIKFFDNHDEVTQWFKFYSVCFQYRNGICEYLNLESSFTYDDYIELNLKRLSKGALKDEAYYPVYYDKIYLDCKNNIDKSYLQSLYSGLLVDFHGFGFPCLSEQYIEKNIYDSSSVDEYVSKAFPSCLSSMEDIAGKKPIFWKGPIPKIVLDNKLFYIIRINASFSIKEEEKPFVLWKNENPYIFSDKNSEDDEKDIASWAKSKNYFDKNFGGEQYNFLSFRNGRKITSTYFIDDYNEKQRKNSLIVSLTCDDYKLFHERYNVEKEEVLDGCYFE